MKATAWALLFLTHAALAAGPSSTVVDSCLNGRAVAAGVELQGIANSEVLSDETYRPGYNATYLLKLDGQDVGYAKGRLGDALVAKGSLHSLKRARRVLGAPSPSPFEPELAVWSVIREKQHRYLCVSFNFAGLGHSGSFQRVRGGYLLSLKQGPGAPLYYAVEDVRKREGDAAVREADAPSSAGR